NDLVLDDLMNFVDMEGPNGKLTHWCFVERGSSAHKAGRSVGDRCCDHDGESFDKVAVPILNYLVHRGVAHAPEGRWLYLLRVLKKVFVGCMCGNVLAESLTDLRVNWNVTDTVAEALSKLIAADSDNVGAKNKLHVHRICQHLCTEHAQWQLLVMISGMTTIEVCIYDILYSKWTLSELLGREHGSFPTIQRDLLRMMERYVDGEQLAELTRLGVDCDDDGVRRWTKSYLLQLSASTYDHFEKRFESPPYTLLVLADGSATDEEKHMAINSFFACPDHCLSMFCLRLKGLCPTPEEMITRGAAIMEAFGDTALHSTDFCERSHNVVRQDLRSDGPARNFTTSVNRIFCRITWQNIQLSIFKERVAPDRKLTPQELGGFYERCSARWAEMPDQERVEWELLNKADRIGRHIQHTPIEDRRDCAFTPLWGHDLPHDTSISTPIDPSVYVKCHNMYKSNDRQKLARHDDVNYVHTAPRRASLMSKPVDGTLPVCGCFAKKRSFCRYVASPAVVERFDGLLPVLNGFVDTLEKSVADDASCLIMFRGKFKGDVDPMPPHIHVCALLCTRRLRPNVQIFCRCHVKKHPSDGVFELPKLPAVLRLSTKQSLQSRHDRTFMMQSSEDLCHELARFHDRSWTLHPLDYVLGPDPLMDHVVSEIPNEFVLSKKIKACRGSALETVMMMGAASPVSAGASRASGSQAFASMRATRTTAGGRVIGAPAPPEPEGGAIDDAAWQDPEVELLHGVRDLGDGFVQDIADAMEEAIGDSAIAQAGDGVGAGAARAEDGEGDACGEAEEAAALELASALPPEAAPVWPSAEAAAAIAIVDKGSGYITCEAPPWCDFGMEHVAELCKQHEQLFDEQFPKLRR
ncbi:unnamed protein product, partial [Prorocentrum cordatum]